jgi:hypothetical protein
MYGKTCLGLEIDRDDNISEFSLGYAIGEWMSENDENLSQRDLRSSLKLAKV